MSTVRLWRIRLRALGSLRLRMAMLCAALAATTLTLLTSLPAHAAPSPTPTPSASTPAPTTGGTAPSPQEMAEAQKFAAEVQERLSKTAQAALLEATADDLRKQLPKEGGILGVFNVTDANNLPISVYSVQSDTGDFTRWDLGVMNLLTEACFMITKWLIAFCCWLIAWSLSFGLAKLLLSPALAVANSLHTRVITEMGLPSLFLAICALICTGRIFFGDRAKGWGDAAVSIVLAALTTTLLSSTPQTLLGDDTGAVAVTRQFALEVADVILDANPDSSWTNNDVTTPATSFTLSRPLTNALTEAFIVRPAELLQYGQVFEGACADDYAQTQVDQLAYNRTIDTVAQKATQYNDVWDPTQGNYLSYGANWQVSLAVKWTANHYGGPPTDTFEKKCVKGDISAAKKASLDKLGGSFFLLIAAIIVTVLIITLAGSFLTAQCRIAWDAIRGEPALIAGTIPGAGRAFLWDWFASIWRYLTQMLVAVTSLAVFILIIQAVLDPVQTDWGRELTLRFLAVDVVCIAAVKKRKQLQARTTQIANNLKSKLSGSRIGGTHGSIFTPAATPIPGTRHLGRKTARGLIRGTVSAVALATGNPMAAVAYAMPRSLGATTLLYRLNGLGIGRPHAARSAGRVPRAPRQTPPPPPPGTFPGTGRPTTAPTRPTPPLPSGPPSTSSGSARPTGTRPGGTTGRSRPRHPQPVQPAASPRQQQLRRRLDRGIRRTPPTPRSSLLPNRASRDEYEAWLREQEAAELQRREDQDPADG
ncbi:hypothetical protein ACFQ0G_53295 [Streptomyces chiangmaiensis]|uniref:hypothetical protein n=1 Tax=Streptomyces chiangmaiensis TaxID=766497 RepID=UPI0031EC6F0F